MYIFVVKRTYLCTHIYVHILWIYEHIHIFYFYFMYVLLVFIDRSINLHCCLISLPILYGSIDPIEYCFKNSSF